ncbi:MAG: TIGR04255 family protein [Syntrophobacterales bacterium]|nr:TIGR04255 family protein [Syntrophobacterales bacterium]
MAKELKNKPLVEAILEIRWKLQGLPSGPQVDPHYKLLLGRLFDRMLKDYPEHEQLPTANVPDELVGHVVQHRFRVAASNSR